MAEKMKDSGIEWIGEVPESWEIKKIKYLFNVFSGSTPDSGNTDYWDGDVLWITPADFDTDDVYIREGSRTITRKGLNACGTKMTPKNSIIFSKRAPVGKVAINMSMLCTNQGCFSCVPHGRVSSKYFYYVMSICTEIFELNSSGSTFKEISADSFKSMKMPLPDFHEQRAIASFLDRRCAQIDGIIADLERQIDLLKRYKKSLITETVTKGLDKNAPMKDSGVEWIGEIPKSWKLSRVKYLMDDEHPYPIGDGDHGLIKAEDYLQEGIPYIRVLNLTWGMGLNMENIVYIPESLNNIIKNSELKPGDLLIAKTGATIGKTAIVPEWMPVSNTTSHVGKITMPKLQCAKYFYYVLTSDIVQKQIEDLSAMQSTRPELGIEGLKNLVLTVPTLDEQHKIVNFLDSKCEDVDSLLGTKEIQLDKMKNFKQSLIYEYVTGKKRVKETHSCPSEQTS